MTRVPAFQRQADMEKVKLQLAGDLLRSGHQVRIRALGRSMLPSIWPGDFLTIENCSASDVCVGDIVCYVRPPAFVIHRVEKIRSVNGKHVWIMRGDCLGRPDEPVREEQILGRVVVMHRDGGATVPIRRLSFAQSYLGRLLDVPLLQSFAFWLRGYFPSAREPYVGSFSR